MNLFFQKKFPDGSKTYFIQKIWAGIALIDQLCDNYAEEVEEAKENWPYSEECDDPENGWWHMFMKSKPKIHTIRDDKRWKEGVNIHFRQWIGKPYRSKTYQFCPLIPVQSIQIIKIDYSKKGLFRDNKEYPLIYIDGELMGFEEMVDLSVNDGFESLPKFFEYFNESYEGLLIHWTDFKY